MYIPVLFSPLYRPPPYSGISALLYFAPVWWASLSVPNILFSCLSTVFLFPDYCSGHGCIYRPGHLPWYCWCSLQALDPSLYNPRWGECEALSGNVQMPWPQWLADPGKIFGTEPLSPAGQWPFLVVMHLGTHLDRQTLLFLRTSHITALRQGLVGHRGIREWLANTERKRKERFGFFAFHLRQGSV